MFESELCFRVLDGVSFLRFVLMSKKKIFRISEMIFMGFLIGAGQPFWYGKRAKGSSIEVTI